jgi:hypothetical protein
LPGLSKSHGAQSSSAFEAAPFQSFKQEKNIDAIKQCEMFTFRLSKCSYLAIQFDQSRFKGMPNVQEPLPKAKMEFGRTNF